MRPKMTKTNRFGNRFPALLAAFVAIVGTPGLNGAETTAPKPKPAAAIYSVRDPSMIDGFTPRADRIKTNFDLLLATAGGSSDSAVAWQQGFNSPPPTCI